MKLFFLYTYRLLVYFLISNIFIFNFGITPWFYMIIFPISIFLTGFVHNYFYTFFTLRGCDDPSLYFTTLVRPFQFSKEFFSLLVHWVIKVGVYKWVLFTFVCRYISECVFTSIVELDIICLTFVWFMDSYPLICLFSTM